MPLDDLFAEAERQMNICNSCRYCEGYCAVWPALELRTELTKGDLTHLANLCHDCRDCFTACMYTPPHEFDLNPPKVFTEIRERTYGEYVWPRRGPRFLRGAAGGIVISVLAALVMLLLSIPTTGAKVFSADASGSPYDLMPHWLLLIVVGVPSVWAVAIGILAVVRYWRDTHGRLGDLASPRIWGRALATAATLRHMRGGGEEECAYPDEEPTPARRRYHSLTFYGFLLCLLSTMSAAATQEFFGILPPYPLLSVPVVLGTVGGIGLIAGCTGLLVLKRRSAKDQTTETMLKADHGLLGALLVLALTGVLTLVLRDTVVFGVILMIHLGAIVYCFGVAPYTKFMHGVYRLLAIYQDEWEHHR